MRMTTALALLSASLAFTACDNKQESAATPPPPPVGAAPAKSDGYLGTVVRGEQVAVKGIDTAALNQQVSLFNAQEGRYPKDLNELVTMKYLAKLPDAPAGMKITYDATTGKVAVVPQ